MTYVRHYRFFFGNAPTPESNNYYSSFIISSAPLRSLSSLARVILERTRRISCDGCSKRKHTLCLLLWEKGDRLRWMRSWLYFARINNRELFAHHQESDKEQLASDLRRSSFNKANASSVCLRQPPSPTGEGKLKRYYFAYNGSLV